MENKNVFVLCMIILVVSSLMFEGVDCRTLRLKMLDDEALVSMKVSSNGSRSQRPLVKSFVYRLASGPSRRGPGH
ncbi:hypothetical protein CARUB_v10028108mg [Capsella rubella]|uniref:Transmembrane protein n=1 Tax=Capsella rubella TaxID=81985 RepID=R0EZP8_9BRAS|nr:uncharacterized protein LOC17875169 [Capsella rubella]EOA14802.1 hypothetical protein CARUB_v10028108mg [Capsella rubella]